MRQRPDLGRDFSAVSVLTRLLKLRGHVDAGLQAVFREHGLTGPDFGALVTLARISGPAGVSQQRLADELALTPGTVTVRVDRLVAEGLAKRRPDPASKRSTLVVLTPAGQALFERVVPAHLANEERMLAALSGSEREQLSGLLRKLLVEFEGSTPGRRRRADRPGAGARPRDDQHAGRRGPAARVRPARPRRRAGFARGPRGPASR